MRVITPDEFNLEWETFFNSILDGAVFIYPTDTIYGIGCNAENEEAVKKIRDAKNRSKAPFSVIAPSIDWIKENCEVTETAEEWLEKFPGPYTLIFKLKDKIVEWYDEKQFQDIAKASLITLIVSFPAMSIMYMLKYPDLSENYVTYFWFPFYLFLTILTFSSSVLYFNRKG